MSTKYSKAEIQSFLLIQEAQKLITPNAIGEDGGISDIQSKSAKELQNNKLGFNKLLKAAKLDCHWLAHQNIAENYYSGLDGAVDIDKTKALYHYVCAWKLAKKSMYKTFDQQKEYLLLNLCGVLETSDLNNPLVDTALILKLARNICKYSDVAQFKTMSHYIQALIMLRQSQRAKSYVQYQKCAAFKKDYFNSFGYPTKHVIIKAEEMMATMDITTKGLNDGSPGDYDEYKRAFDRFEKQKEALNAEHPTDVKKMSGLQSKLETVLVKRSREEGKQNTLVTVDPRLNMTTQGRGKAAERTCNYCGKLGLNMKRCSKCKKVHYCDLNCQRPDWKKHKPICKSQAKK